MCVCLCGVLCVTVPVCAHVYFLNTCTWACIQHVPYCQFFVMSLSLGICISVLAADVCALCIYTVVLCVGCWVCALCCVCLLYIALCVCCVVYIIFMCECD